MRNTRTTTAKDSENANVPARPLRATSRAKPLSSTLSVAAASAAGGKSKAGTGNSKAEAPAGKRKREALGEVTVLGNRTAKGKQKEESKKFDGVVLNKSKILGVRQPLRQVGGTQQQTNGVPSVLKDEPLEQIAELAEPLLQVHDENAMLIDHPPVLPSITIRKSLLPEDQVPREPRRTNSRRQLASRSRPVEEDAGENRVFKKRRTSSEAPADSEATEQAQLQAEQDALTARIEDELAAFVEESEADPEGSNWEDLDAEDAEDPLMVSEYVVEVFEYYKQIEVRIVWLLYRHVF